MIVESVICFYWTNCYLFSWLYNLFADELAASLKDQLSDQVAIDNDVSIYKDIFITHIFLYRKQVSINNTFVTCPCSLDEFNFCLIV